MIDETTLQSWTVPLGSVEDQQCQNLLSMVRKAISNSDALKYRNVEVRGQGSYASNTNVRQNSDMDICVICHDTVFNDYNGTGLSPASVGMSPATYEYSQYILDVENALKAVFGSDVTRGDKAFKIAGNNYRLGGDVVACFEHRRWITATSWHEGTQFITRSGSSVINWPEQNLRKGRDRNNETNQNYKKLVRILKKVRYNLKDTNDRRVAKISSFLVENLVYMCPTNLYGKPTWG